MESAGIKLQPDDGEDEDGEHDLVATLPNLFCFVVDAAFSIPPLCAIHRYRRHKIDCSSLFTVPATSAAQNSLLFFFFLLRLLTELLSKQGRP